MKITNSNKSFLSSSKYHDIFLVLYPWLIWTLSSSFLFYKYLLQVSPSVMVQYLMADFHLSGTQMGSLAAFYFYAYLLMQIPVGLLLDRYSPRYIITIAIFLCASGAFIFATASTFSIAALGRIVIGVGGAFSAVGTMKLITLWFPPRQFALVAGLMMSAGMLGAVGGEAPLAYLVDNFSWRNSLLIIGLIGFILAAIFGLLVRERDPVKPDFTAHQVNPPFWQGLKEVVSHPQSWLLSLYSSLAFAPITAFAGLWGVPYLTIAYHLTHTQVAGIVSLIFIGFAVGAPFSGWLSEWINRRKPIMAGGTAAALLCILLIFYVPQLPITLLSSLLFLLGFFASFFFVSFSAMRETHSLIFAGTAIGFINTFNEICGAVSEPLIGKILDMGWEHTMQNGARVFSLVNYHWALSIIPAELIIGLIVLALVKETFCNRSGY